MPLEVGIYVEGEAAPRIERIEMKEREASFEFAVGSGEKVEKVVLDPGCLGFDGEGGGGEVRF